MRYDLGTNGNGVKETIYDEGSRLVVARKQNVAPILDANKALRDHRNKFAHGRIASQIPVVLYYQWRKEWETKWADKFTWQTFRNLKLNSSDYKKLRTDEGQRL